MFKMSYDEFTDLANALISEIVDILYTVNPKTKTKEEIEDDLYYYSFSYDEWWSGELLEEYIKENYGVDNHPVCNELIKLNMGKPY